MRKSVTYLGIPEQVDQNDIHTDDNHYCENFATKCDCDECKYVPASVKTKAFVRGLACCFGSFLINVFLGCLYLWGSISGYYISYLHYNGQPEITQADTLAVIPISWIVSSLFSPLGTTL